MIEQQSRPEGNRAAQVSIAADLILGAEDAHLFGVGASQSAITALNRRGLSRLAECWPVVLESIASRFLQDAITSQLPGFWLRRAEELEQVGTGWADEAAVACRRHAWLLSSLAVDEQDEVPELAALLGEVA